MFLDRHLSREKIHDELCGSSAQGFLREMEDYSGDYGTEDNQPYYSPEEHRLITIPKNIWNGFKGLEKNISIVANCLTLPHNEKEMVRKDPFDKFFKYHW